MTHFGSYFCGTRRSHLVALLCIVYTVGFILFVWLHDLQWQPPPIDDSIANAMLRKRNPDGPLIIRDDPVLSAIGSGRGVALHIGGGSSGPVAEVNAKPASMEVDPLMLIKSVSQLFPEKRTTPKALEPSESFLKKFRAVGTQIQQNWFPIMLTSPPLNETASLDRLNSVTDIENVSIMASRNASITKKHATKQFLLFTVINDAYLNLTLNWLCNFHALENRSSTVPASPVLIVVASASEMTCTRIERDWPHVNCMTMTKTRGGDKISASHAKPLAAVSQRLRQLMALRASLIVELAEMEIPLVQFEVDSAWLRNPINALFGQQGQTEDVDIVLPVSWPNEKGQHYVPSPLLALPSQATLTALREIRRQIVAEANRNGASAANFEQEIVNNVCGRQFNGVVCRDFEWYEVADGEWFRMSDTERKRTFATAPPFIVNNNRYADARDKQSRQSLAGTWFLMSTKSTTCNLDKARRALAKLNVKEKI